MSPRRARPRSPKVNEAALAPRRGMLRTGNAEAARLLALLLPLGLLGGALGSQYIGGLHPCEMCYWQRWPHGAAILLAAAAFTAPAASSRSRMLTKLAAAAIAVSGAIGVYHAGVEAGVFEGFTPCTTTPGTTRPASSAQRAFMPGSSRSFAAILRRPSWSHAWRTRSGGISTGSTPSWPSAAYAPGLGSRSETSGVFPSAKRRR